MEENNKITGEELENVSGGISSTTGTCPHCHKHVTITVSGSTLTCTSCGHSWTAWC